MTLIGMLVLGLTTLMIMAVVGLVVAGFSLVMWIVLLPFRFLGLVFKGLGLLFALPFMLLFGAIGALIFGLGAFVFLVPFLPFVLLAFLLWRWIRGRPRVTVSA